MSSGEPLYLSTDIVTVKNLRKASPPQTSFALLTPRPNHKMADDDVVFVNSPLFQHLTEVGFTDFDAQRFHVAPEKVGENVGASAHLDPINPVPRTSGPRYFLGRICGLIWCFLATSTKSKDAVRYSSYLSVINSSKLLTDDDAEFVYRFEKGILAEADTFEHDIIATTITKNPCVSGSVGTGKRNWFPFINSEIVIGFVALIAIILGCFTAYDNHLRWLSTALFTSFGILLCICVCNMFFLWQNFQIDHLHDHNLLLLGNYLEAMEGLLVLIRKAVLLIQEKELLARGHIVISPTVPVTRMEANSPLHRQTIKHCIALRKCIFTETKDFLCVLQNKTKALSCLSLFKNSKIFSWFGQHVLRVDNEWLNIGVDADADPNEFSLVLLKKILSSLVDQQSLLLCYTSLMSLFIVSGQNNSSKNEDHLGIIKNCFECLLVDVNEHSNKIKQCYRFYRTGATDNVLNEERIKIVSNRLGSTYSPFLMAVHSMNLHLQEASTKSSSIEEKLEEIGSKTTSVEEFIVDHFDEIEKKLMHMKSNLDNLVSCWDESHNRLQSLRRGLIAQNKEKSESCSKDEASRKSSGDQVKDDVKIVSINGEVDFVPDQIFEGDTCSEIDEDKYCSPTLNREELFKEQKAREESRYLLRELKSVLATKDGRSMVGIPKALLSKRFDGSDSTSTINERAVDLMGKVTSTDVESQSSSTCINTPECYKDQSKYDSNELEHGVDKFNGFNHTSNQSTFAEMHDLGIDFGIERTNVVNPFASMIAAAALARNKEFGLKEQRYGEDDQTETFGDEA